MWLFFWQLTLATFALLAVLRLARRNDLSERERFAYGALAIFGAAIVLVTGYLGAIVAGEFESSSSD